MKYYATKLSENISETPEGFLVCIGVPIARTGDMDYGPGETPIPVGPNGKTVISREESEVFRPETIASFEGKSVTISHPKDFVDPKNWKDLTKGTVQNVRRGTGDFKDSLIADLLITDQVAIQLVKNGLREVSCGYEAEYVELGEGKGQQTNIVGNHVALVDQGRAGDSYAINDHKGVSKMSYTDKIKALFAKTQDEMEKIAKDEGPEVTEKNKSIDAEEHKKMMDELIKSVADLGEKVSAMAGKKEGEDADSEAAGGAGEKDKKEEKPSKDADESGLAEKLSKLQAEHEEMKKMLEKVLKHVGDDMESEDEEPEVVGDDDEEESEDDDYEESGMTGDSKSRAEILAPGIAKDGKDLKVRALKQYAQTKDGKKIVLALNDGKEIDFKDEKKVSTLFVATSEALKAMRRTSLARTRTNDFSADLGDAGPMTAEKMNEKNAKHYGLK